MDNFLAIDVHIHVQPLEMMTPEALESFGMHHKDFAEVRELVGDPTRFLKYLDRVGV